MRELVLVLLLLLMSHPASARNTKLMVSYEDAMSTPVARSKLGSDVKFYFGKQEHPSVAHELGEFSANKKTNAFNKTDQAACEWAFLSAMISLKNRAVAEGGDAVVGIRSFYKKRLLKSSTEFECGAGAFVAGVALKGTVVKLK